MSKRTLTEIKLTKEGLKDILIKHFDLPEDSTLSFNVEEEEIYSKYDDPRDPPSYKYNVTDIILKHETTS